MKKTAYIVGAGRFCPRALRAGRGDLIIAADGGYDSLRAIGLRPHLVIGDLDSSAERITGVPVLRFPVRKDDTDLSLALRYASNAGCTAFRLYGADGGPREDHFLGALQLMAARSEQGADIRLIAGRFTVYALSGGVMALATRPGQTVSVFSHSPLSRGVSLSGLSFEAEGLTLSSGFPLGISNAATGSRAVIGVRRGTLLIYQGL